MLIMWDSYNRLERSTLEEKAVKETGSPEIIPRISSARAICLEMGSAALLSARDAFVDAFIIRILKPTSIVDKYTWAMALW